MKLKLKTQSPETLRRCLAQINTFRNFVVLRFTPDELLAILANVSLLLQEPQVWCKFPMYAIFSEVEVVSQRDNTIMVEINIDLFLQALRNFDRANSRDFNIRLQRKEGAGKRSAYMALQYTEVANAALNHTLRIPVKILKGNVLMKVPELPRVDMMMRLPQEFAAMFRRLEKFGSATKHDCVTIRATRRDGGSLLFLLKEADSYKVCLAWKARLELQESLELDSLAAVADVGAELGAQRSPSSSDALNLPADVEVTVKLHDWCLAHKIVGSCKAMVFLMCHNNACVIHCLLDDAEEVELMFYISGIRSD